MTNFLDRDQYFAARLSRQVLTKLFDLRTFAADDDARSRGIDDDLEPRRCTFDIDVRNAAAAEAPFQITLEPEILGEVFRELMLGKPVRVPVLVVADSKSVWMNFLSHNLVLSPAFRRPLCLLTLQLLV